MNQATHKIYVAGHCGTVVSDIVRTLQQPGQPNFVTRPKQSQTLPTKPLCKFSLKKKPTKIDLAAAKLAASNCVRFATC